MEEHTATFEIATTAAATAELVGQFDLVADFQPQIAACMVDGDGVGARRTLTMSDGSLVLEELVEERDDGYVYELIDGPTGIASYRIGIAIAERGPDACVVTWTLQLTMEEGRDAGPAVHALRSLAEVGIELAKRQLERVPGP